MASSPPRQKRRKASCKEFQCTHEGCGRTYSRAEHLQRHQLNHSPKEVYYCDYPGCSFTFVRKDLYARHKLRHERQMEQYGTGRLAQRPSSSHRELSKLAGNRLARYSFSEDGSAWSDTQDEGPNFTDRPARKSRLSFGDGQGETVQQNQPQDVTAGQSRRGSRGSDREPALPKRDMTGPARSGASKLPRSRESSVSRDKQPGASHVPLHMDPPMQAPDLTMPSPGGVPQRQDRTAVAGNTPYVMQNGMAAGGAGDQLMEDQPFGLSPSSTDEFTAWLFNGQGMNSGYSFMPGSASFGVGGYSNNFGQLCPDYSTQPGMMDNSFFEPAGNWFQSEPMTMATPMVDVSLVGKTGLSEHKRQSLLQYMMQRFNEIGSQGTRSAADIKTEIFGSDSDAENHVLSHHNVQRYITSYWENLHDQLPILHRPTFVPETAHDFLLLAVLIMGASMLDKSGGPSDMTEKISKFTTFVSWNLRWQVFMHADSHPPAKLWVIQTLLILELYEKMNATRVLHERAHIYFPTTLSLMRRGSALTGKQSSYVSRAQSPLNSPRNGADAKMLPMTGRPSLEASPDRWWDHWIAQEATRRAAFAAFILDATHSALFGHTPTLGIHEINLPLPCDNTLWSSESPSEIGCVESSLHANGVTPITFLDGLQKTLNGQRVRTSPYGRIALLAALMSVTWQMHQRDLDRSTLGTDTLPGAGVQERWRPKLLRAFDWWKKDYDEGVAHIKKAAFDWQRLGLSSRGGSDDGDAFQTLGTVLYHLGHITVYISMPELCIFAGVKQILGRTVTSLDWQRTECKIKDWVASPGAIGGVYHAFQLIKLILLQEEEPGRGGGAGATFAPPAAYPAYKACHDNILTRTWALYYASLVLWVYGYVQDGSLDPYPDELQYPPPSNVPVTMTVPSIQRPDPTPANKEQTAQVSAGASASAAATAAAGQATPASQDEALKRERHENLKTYLQIMIPPHIDSIKAFHVHQNQAGVVGNRNKVVGLLSIVDEALGGTRWELLSEARARLRMAASTMQNPCEAAV